MAGSFLTDNDFESTAQGAPAVQTVGRGDCVAPATGRWADVRILFQRALSAGPSVTERTYEALGSTTTDTGGNAP